MISMKKDIEKLEVEILKSKLKPELERELLQLLNKVEQDRRAIINMLDNYMLRND